MADFTYKRKDGGTTLCYGKVQEASNFSVVCDNEYNDGIVTDINTDEYNTWRKVCKYLEDNYNDKIEQIEEC